jgi:hypothetical protein
MRTGGQSMHRQREHTAEEGPRAMAFRTAHRCSGLPSGNITRSGGHDGKISDNRDYLCCGLSRIEYMRRDDLISGIGTCTLRRSNPGNKPMPARWRANPTASKGGFFNDWHISSAWLNSTWIDLTRITARRLLRY